MKFYLSSYELGDEKERFKQLFSASNRVVGYIPNARDFSAADPVRVLARTHSDMHALKELGLEVELLNLKDYFGKEQALHEKIDTLGGVWISGGNVFVLRQAMHLSGFDTILRTISTREDFVYGGYSAAGCVLSPTLKGYAIVDDATDVPYPGSRTIWEGLGFIEYAFLPHFESDHPESAAVSEGVLYCQEHGIPYKTLRDGEAIIIE